MMESGSRYRFLDQIRLHICNAIPLITHRIGYAHHNDIIFNLRNQRGLMHLGYQRITRNVMRYLLVNITCGGRKEYTIMLTESVSREGTLDLIFVKNQVPSRSTC